MTLFPSLLPAYLLLCILLGGASAGGYVENLVLQLTGICIIVSAIWTWPRHSLLRQERNFLFLVIALWLVVVMQLIPLPYALWEQLPMRAIIGEEAQSIGAQPVPVFLTLVPHETIKSAVWLLPAMALSLEMLRLRIYRADFFAWALLTGTTLSVIVGALQLAGGRDSALYFYEFTNWGSTVGFFANSNHLATLLLVSIPFLAALVAKYRARKDATRGVRWLIGAALLGVILTGIYMNGSLAGYGLVLPVLAASAAILIPERRSRHVIIALVIPIVLAGLVLVLSTEEGRQMLDETSNLGPGARQVIFANTWQAIGDFFPAGSGIGSFAEVYRLYQDPSLGSSSYINHAHNDYLEILLETGILGAIVFAAFFIWWARRAFRIWMSHRQEAFPCAAAIASATILVHSVVDYPLRTAAMSSIFALCCMLMVDWISWKTPKEDRPLLQEDEDDEDQEASSLDENAGARLIYRD